MWMLNLEITILEYSARKTDGSDDRRYIFCYSTFCINMKAKTYMCHGWRKKSGNFANVTRFHFLITF